MSSPRIRFCLIGLFSFLLAMETTSLQAQEVITLEPTKDSFVQRGRGNKGTSSNLGVRNSGQGHSSTRNAWFGFDISQFADAGGPVERVEFRVYLGRLSAAGTTHTVFAGSNDWQENEIEYVSPTNPEVLPFALAQQSLTSSDVDSWIVYDVTDYVSALVEAGETEMTLVIEAEDRAYSHYRARSTRFSPELTLTTGSASEAVAEVEAVEVEPVVPQQTEEAQIASQPEASSSASAQEAGGIFVDDVDSLRRALDNARAGDVILVAPGQYAPSNALTERYASGNRGSYFRADASGSANAPIVLKAADPSNPPVLKGLRNTNSVYVLWIRGEHWRVENLVLERGGKGLMLDESSHTVISGVTVNNVGDEGIHLRSGTSNTILENCVIKQCGKNQPGFGEGIYIGSDGSQWNRFDEKCHDNIVRGCEVRATTAECIDVKEGTKNTIIEDCAFYGSKISGVNFADSFIDLKGVSARVRNNRFYKENNETVTRGVAIVHRRNGPTAERNWIAGNQFFLNNSNGVMVHAYRGEDNYTWNNVRSPAGRDYQGNSPELLFEPQFDD